jgi:alkylhydroperoxidase family enzyme
MPEPVGLTSVAWEQCVLERRPDREVTRYIRQHAGFVPPHLDYFTPCPWLARQFVYWDSMRIPLLVLDPALVEMLSLVVAQDNSCRYCFAATRTFLRTLGFGKDTIRVLEQDLVTADLPASTRVALEFARRLSRANPLPGPEALARLAVHGFDRDATREIVYVTGLSVLANRIITLAAIPPERMERLSEQRWIGLLRPVAALLVRRNRRRVHPMALPAAMQAGPFGHVVRAFEGHPLGPRLWTQIDEAWSSPILPRRTKALIAAVVGHALGCASSVAEARRLLASDGAGLDLDGVLAHLGSPDLSPEEAVIVPFVRETVHYSPAQIQRRARVVYEHLGPPAFLETLGVAALANALCRMTAVLAAPRP